MSTENNSQGDRVYSNGRLRAESLHLRHYVTPLSFSTACKQASGRDMRRERNNKLMAYLNTEVMYYLKGEPLSLLR